MKKLLSVLVILAMLMTAAAITAVADEPPGPPPDGAAAGAPPAEAPAPAAAPAAEGGIAVTFVSDAGAELASAQAEGGELVFGISCSPPTDIVTIEVSGGSLECQQSTAGGPSVPQGTINGIWTLSGITEPVTVTLTLNTQEGAEPPVFYFGAEEAAANISAGGGMAGPPPGEAPPDAAPVYDVAPDAGLITFVSDAGVELASAPAEGGELVFGISCSPPTDIVSIDVSGGVLECLQSTAGGPSVPQGTINGIWTLSGITGPVTVTLNLNTMEGADPPVFYFGAEEAEANISAGGGMAGPPPGEAPPAEPVLVGPPTGGGQALIVMLICLLALAALVPAAIKIKDK